MAAIYNSITGDLITGGLQGCRTCVGALDMARKMARERNQAVHLEDDDGDWLVHPDGHLERVQRDAM